MQYIDHKTDVYDALNIPGCPRAHRGALDPNINEGKLESLYGELANVLLQLSRLSLPRIGSLDQIDDFTWEVAQRPLSMAMNELVRLGSLPQSQLPSRDTTFDTTSSYFEALAELHIAHLRYQRNDAIDSADDCRRKFIARHLFRKLAREGQLTKRWKSLDKGPFKIWSDSFCPANVLLNADLRIVGVVDWEFTYAAPVEFSYAPPWWLLIEKPENWPGSLEDWSTQFEHRLRTFLKAMVGREDEAIEQGRLQEDERLSGPMRESWESGDFWINYAARNSFAFDAIYWEKIDQRFFGHAPSPEDAWRQRIDILNSKERDDMEKLVEQKVKEMETRVLAWDPDEYTRSHINIARKDGVKEDEAEEDDGTWAIESDKATVNTVSGKSEDLRVVLDE